MLAAVLGEGRALDDVLDEADTPASSSRDAALARAIVATALRRHGEIDAVLSAVMDRAPPRKAGRLPYILRTAAGQLLFMEVPDHAAVSLALAEAERDAGARHFKGLANAVLRRLAREKAELTADLDSPRLDTPDWLWDRWSAHYGEEAARRIGAAHLVEPAVDLTVKSEPAVWAERLGGTVLPTGSVRLTDTGPIDRLDGYAAGAWWVQDAAAALPARLFREPRGQRIADLCAAPGGKTAQLAAAGAAVVAVDRSERRLKRLADNLRRLQLQAETVAADARHWQPESVFDGALVDAPCLSTGTIRRHPDLPLLKRAADLPALVELQRALLETAVRIVRPGGSIVYCVCSLEPEEGEAQAERALRDLPLRLDPVDADAVGGLAEIVNGNGCMRSLPFHMEHDDPRCAGMDGFFAARFVRL